MSATAFFWASSAATVLRETGVEVRFRIDSLQRLKAQLGGVLPGNFSESAFVSGVTNLSGGKAGVREWETDRAREFFDADWVLSAWFTPVDPQFAPDHELALVHCFHRTDIADVYLIGLYRKGEEPERLVLGTEPPVRYPAFSEAAPVTRSSEYRVIWDKACALIRDLINLDGRILPPPTADERRRLAEAITLFDKAVLLQPGNAGPNLFIGKIHQRLGDVRASLASLRKAHAIAPDDSACILELGGSLAQCGLYDDAVSILGMGSTMHPKHPVIHFNLGVALLMSGKAPRAVTVFERLVQLEPQGPYNRKLLTVASEVAEGRRPAPKTEAEVSALL